MTKFMDKTFSVAQPGKDAKMWPKCEKETLSEVHGTHGPCILEFGHRGKCEPDPFICIDRNKAANGGVYAYRRWP